jgi:cytochrome bd-type quinol oxidase subunit 2
MLQKLNKIIQKIWYVLQIIWAAMWLHPKNFSDKEIMIGARCYSMIAIVNTIIGIAVIRISHHEPKSFFEITLLMIFCIIELLAIIEIPFLITAWEPLPK